MYKALQSLRRPLICVFTFNHHSNMGGRCLHPRRVLVTQVKAGGGGLWREFRDSGSQSWVYSASTFGSWSGPGGWLWHCPARCPISPTPALREGSTETQSRCYCSCSVWAHRLNFWTRLCLISAARGADLLASRTPWRLCGFISPPLQIVLWPLLRLCMQTFLTARHQVMQLQNRTHRLEGILEIIKSTSPKPSYKWEQGVVGREITCPKTPLVYVLLKARSCLGPGEISARRLLSGSTESSKLCCPHCLQCLTQY